MNILFMSEFGEALPLAMHSQRQGAECKLFLENKSDIGLGLVPYTKDWKEDVRDADLVVLSTPNMNKYYEECNKWCPVVGGGKLEHQLRKDPSLWKLLFRLGGGQPSSKDVEGVEVVVGAWHGKGGWRLPCVIGQITKGLQDNNKGAGVEGVGMCITSDVGRGLYSTLLNPLGQSLQKQKLVGFVSMVATFDGKVMHPNRVQVGLDSFLLPPLMEITSMSFPRLLKRLSTKRIRSSEVRPEYGVAVGLSIPPFPYPSDSVPKVEINGYNEHNDKHLWLLDVAKHNGNLSCAGLRGHLGYVTSRGYSVGEARKRAYRTIGRLEIPQLQYRDDIGEGFLPLLKQINQSYRLFS